MRRAGLLAATLALLACGPGSDDPAARGRLVYSANCIACHHVDPSLEGPLGPAIVGSSRELIEARLVRGSYPEGYTPKRDSALMQPLPYLAEEVDALAAYLDQSMTEASR